MNEHAAKRVSRVISPLADDEVEAVCALAAAIWRHHYPAIIGRAQTEYMLAQRYAPDGIRADLASGKAWWDVLREDEVMTAFACSFPADSAGALKLDRLYVHPGRQRRGCGGMLIAHVCERATRLGYSEVTLAVNRRNASAIAAYRKHGFEVRESAVTDIGQGFVMDDYVMFRSVKQ